MLKNKENEFEQKYIILFNFGNDPRKIVAAINQYIFLSNIKMFTDDEIYHNNNSAKYIMDLLEFNSIGSSINNIYILSKEEFKLLYEIII